MTAALKPLVFVAGQILEEFNQALNDPKDFQYLLNKNGWVVENLSGSQLGLIRTAINVSDSVEQILSLLVQIKGGKNNFNTLLNQILPIIENTYDIIDNVKYISSSSFNFFPVNQADFWAEFGANLFDTYFASYLKNKSSILFAILYLSDIITEDQVYPAGAKRIPYKKYRINWAQLGTLISNPKDIIHDAYGWGNSTGLDTEKILSKLSNAINLFGGNASRIIIDELNYNRFLAQNPTFSQGGTEQLNIDILKDYVAYGNDFNELNLNLIPVPKDNSTQIIDGIALQLENTGGYQTKFRIAPSLFVSLDSQLETSDYLLLKITPNDTQFITNFSATNFQTEIAFTYLPETPILFFGTPFTSRLEFLGIDFSIAVNGSYDDPEFIIKVGNGKLINLPFMQFTFEPGNADNFIQKIIGETPFSLGFGGTLRWSSKFGFGFEGNTSFSIEIPLKEQRKNKDSSSPVQLDAIRIALLADGKNTDLNLGLDFFFNLSAVKASIRNIGLKLQLSDKEGTGGKGLFDNLDFDLAFKFPDGVALEINAPPVKGGGFLNYDEATSTYTGGLELQFSKISFSAIGIISTKLPGGQKGYSLLVIVSVEFTPLQIGMGFTINGIGGLLGLHRTSNPDVLRTGIRYNTLDHILFPKNIVENVNAIISNLGQAFPVRKDQFMLGPMAKIGWGTPTLLTIDIGIIIELPDPVRLIILGILRAQLPSAQNPILQIQVNFLGIIDFKEKYLSFDATLYDSKILTFGLFGDMALRLNWGDRPNFLLSVGGFHPSYTPPPLNLPSMQRLTIILADENNLKISVESYFAVTSNSAQFGARVYAMAKAWKITAEGELWFNVLFQFSPFYFAADMGVKFAIKMGSKTLLGIYVALLLEGPDPWRAQGQAAFKILLVKVKVRFDATFGRQRAEAIEAVKVDEKIKEALMLPDNWETQLPNQNNQMVSWRKEAEGEGQSVDPSGAIKINQRVMPLNTVMQKFGSAAISDFNRYRITDVRIGTLNAPKESVQDYFARSEFSNMTDEEKLSRDGYELFDSGVIVGSTENQSSQYAVHKESAFEEITIDSGFRRKELEKHFITDVRMKIDSLLGYTTRTGLSAARLRTTSVGPDKIKLSLKDGEFVLADRNNLQQVGGGISFANSMDAERYLIQQRELSPTTVENWIIANRYELVD